MCLQKRELGQGQTSQFAKELRNLYNRITVSNVIFDPPVGPEIFIQVQRVNFKHKLESLLIFMRTCNGNY